jgi:hypothetical protein
MLHSIGLYFSSTGKMTAPTGPRFSRQPRGKRPLRVIWSRPATLEPRGKQGETPQLWSRLSQNGYRPKQIICTCKLSRTPCLRLGDIIQRGDPSSTGPNVPGGCVCNPVPQSQCFFCFSMYDSWVSLSLCAPRHGGTSHVFLAGSIC